MPLPPHPTPPVYLSIHHLISLALLYVLVIISNTPVYVMGCGWGRCGHDLSTDLPVLHHSISPSPIILTCDGLRARSLRAGLVPLPMLHVSAHLGPSPAHVPPSPCALHEHGRRVWLLFAATLQLLTRALGVGRWGEGGGVVVN